MEFKDYYQILGVDEKVDASELKKVYRKLARKYHPDVSEESDCEARFKEVNEAYEVLKDPEKRAEYDQLKVMGGVDNKGQFRPPPDWQSSAHFSQGGFTGSDAGGFSDFFETIFGQAGASGRQQYTQSAHQQFRMRGDDLHIKVPLFIEEVYAGCDKIIEYQIPGINEQGMVVHQNKRFKVKIPAGSSPSKPIRLKGQGGAGMGGADNGDLFLDLELVPHPVYSVRGNDLYRKLAITPWEAALGASVKVNTLSGDVQLTVPPDSQSGQQLRLKGKGLHDGDLYVELDIIMPKVSTGRMKELYQELSQESGFNPREGVA